MDLCFSILSDLFVELGFDKGLFIFRFYGESLFLTVVSCDFYS